MSDELINIVGDEQSRLDPTLADGGLPPVVGVKNYCVFRASRAVPEQADGVGFTYHHHVDMAAWRGRLYVAWNSCERDEDVWPSRELFSTSIDGVNWTPPAELFPMGMSTALRMYFFLASTGRLLVIAGLRRDKADVEESLKGGLVVREIRGDHTLGPTFLLRGEPGIHGLDAYPTSGDATFIQSCDELLSDPVFLEQQDHGVLLGERKMKWHSPASWPGGVVPGDDSKWTCGKAWSFFTRPDGAIVGTSKMGFTTISRDAGRSWDMPVIPPSFIVGKAKTFAHRTRDGRYALVYNPSRRQRFPLAVVTGSDGRTFGQMRIVHGELPRQRYEGRHRSIGPQYVRGLSRWSDDGSFDTDAMWVVYSVNKEDIWVSRLPLPIAGRGPSEVDDDFARTPSLDAWNIYKPKWAVACMADRSLKLSSNDPYDFAAATRVFAPEKRLRIRLRLAVDSLAASAVECDLLSEFGSIRVLRLSFDSAGGVRANDVAVGRFSPGMPLEIDASVNVDSSSATISVDDAHPVSVALAAAENVQRITVRTGTHRNIGGANPVDPLTDRPVEATTLRVLSLRISPA